jgi:hypothetical protein
MAVPQKVLDDLVDSCGEPQETKAARSSDETGKKIKDSKK